MWRTCAARPARGPSVSSRARPAPSGTRRTTHAWPFADSTVSSEEPSSAMTFGSRSATPCESSVRAKSTGSPPAPRSSIRAASVTPVDHTGVTGEAVPQPRPGPCGQGAGLVWRFGSGGGRGGLLDVPRQQRLARDHEPLDLRGALVELHDLRVAHELLDGVVLDEAVAAVDLDGVGGDLHRAVGGEALRVRGLERVALGLA